MNRFCFVFFYFVYIFCLKCLCLRFYSVRFSVTKTIQTNKKYIKQKILSNDKNDVRWWKRRRRQQVAFVEAKSPPQAETICQQKQKKVLPGKRK